MTSSHFPSILWEFPNSWFVGSFCCLNLKTCNLEVFFLILSTGLPFFCIILFQNQHIFPFLHSLEKVHNHFMHNPFESHYKVVKRIIRYLWCTNHFDLHLRKSYTLDLVGFYHVDIGDQISMIDSKPHVILSISP